MNNHHCIGRIFKIALFILLIIGFAFPSQAHAKKLNRLLREFVHDVTGVSFIKGAVGGLSEFGYMFSGTAQMLFSPIPVFGQLIAFSTTPKDVLSDRLDYKKHIIAVANGLERQYTADVYVPIGVCKKTDFQKSLSPDCMTMLYSTEKTGSFLLTVIQIKAATAGNTLYTYFKYNDKNEDTHGATPPLIGIGMLIVEDNTSHLSLYCNKCNTVSQNVIVNNIFPLGTRVIFKDDEALFVSPFGAVGLQPGDSISITGIIGIESIRPSPFVRINIPESHDAEQ